MVRSRPSSIHSDEFVEADMAARWLRLDRPDAGEDGNRFFKGRTRAATIQVGDAALGPPSAPPRQIRIEIYTRGVVAAGERWGTLT